MLSGETANGLFPIESVKIMNETCCEAEANINYRELFLKIRSDVRAPQQNVAESVASSAVKTAWDLSAAMVMALSNTGNTARLVSKYRPHCPILCVTPSLQTARQLLVTRGVFPYMVDHLQGTVEKTSEHGSLNDHSPLSHYLARAGRSEHFI
jgi:pyruvate kinase